MSCTRKKLEMLCFHITTVISALCIYVDLFKKEVTVGLNMPRLYTTYKTTNR